MGVIAALKRCATQNLGSGLTLKKPTTKFQVGSNASHQEFWLWDRILPVQDPALDRVA